MKRIVRMRYLLLYCILSFGSSYGQLLSPSGLDSLQTKRKATKIIDLRGETAFERGHIRYALSYPYEKANFKELFLSQFPASIPIVLYCQTGRVSQEAQIYLSGLGYREVYVLTGGFDLWTLSSKPYVTQHPTTEPIAPITYEQLQQTTAAFPVVAVLLAGDQCPECLDQKKRFSKVLPHLPILEFKGFRVEGIREQLQATESTVLLIFQRGKQVWRLDDPWKDADLNTLSGLFQP